MRITLKSSQFHGSRRKVNFPTQKPRARIFMRDSKVYIPVNVYLVKNTKVRKGGSVGGEVERTRRRGQMEAGSKTW